MRMRGPILFPASCLHKQHRALATDHTSGWGLQSQSYQSFSFWRSSLQRSEAGQPSMLCLLSGSLLLYIKKILLNYSFPFSQIPFKQPESDLCYNSDIDFYSWRRGVEQDKFRCGSTGTSSGNSQETETCMVRACHTSRQPLQNHLQGILEGGRRRGRQRNHWMDDIKERTFLPLPELLTRTSCRKDWETIPAESSFMFTQRPTQSVKGLNWTEPWYAEFCFAIKRRANESLNMN